MHFNWILDGRAIQDVWMNKDASTKRMIPGGTTIRFYDPEKLTGRVRGFLLFKILLLCSGVGK